MAGGLTTIALAILMGIIAVSIMVSTLNREVYVTQQKYSNMVENIDFIKDIKLASFAETILSQEFSFATKDPTKCSQRKVQFLSFTGSIGNSSNLTADFPFKSRYIKEMKDIGLEYECYYNP